MVHPFERSLWIVSDCRMSRRLTPLGGFIVIISMGRGWSICQVLFHITITMWLQCFWSTRVCVCYEYVFVLFSNMNACFPLRLWFVHLVLSSCSGYVNSLFDWINEQAGSLLLFVNVFYEVWWMEIIIWERLNEVEEISQTV